MSSIEVRTFFTNLTDTTYDIRESRVKFDKCHMTFHCVGLGQSGDNCPVGKRNSPT